MWEHLLHTCCAPTSVKLQVSQKSEVVACEQVDDSISDLDDGHGVLGANCTIDPCSGDPMTHAISDIC